MSRYGTFEAQKQPRERPIPSQNKVRSVDDQQGMDMLLIMGLAIGACVLLVIIYTSYKSFKARQEKQKAIEKATAEAISKGGTIDAKAMKYAQKVANGGVMPVKSTPMEKPRL